MDKEVLIHVSGLQTMDAEGDQEPIEIVVPGQYYFRNGSHYLRYEELLDETAEPTINYIKMSEKGLSSTGMEKKDFPYRFFVSDLADEFKAFANSILPYDVEMTKKIDIEKY